MDPDGVIRHDLLIQLPWLSHGFGTRLSPDWTGASPTATLQQIHSDIVLDAGSHCGPLGEGDALVTNQPGLWLAVRTADCVPILLADPTRKVVSAVHAGWRGTAARIAAKTVQHMAARYGSQPHDILAVIGPSIGACCYEVGAGVAEQFRQWLPLSPLPHPQHIDLPLANSIQLGEVGVQQVRTLGTCTQCHPSLFHSFRRDKDQAGRMVSAIAITP